MNTIPLPPETLQLYTGPSTGEGFLVGGKHWINIFVDRGFLNTDYKVLDIGCGSGKTARFMTDKIDSSSGGEFHGLDIHDPCIQWCKDNIGKMHSNFIFKHADVRNPYYNAEGSIKPDEFTFPYDNDYFDFSYSTSLFTHMTKQSVEHYLGEIFRVCKSGGTHFSTFFCFEKDVSKIEKSKHLYPKKLFKHDDVSYVMYPDNPCAFIAYPNSFLEKLITDAGFKVEGIIDPDDGWQAGWILKKLGGDNAGTA